MKKKLNFQKKENIKNFMNKIFYLKMKMINKIKIKI